MISEIMQKFNIRKTKISLYTERR